MVTKSAKVQIAFSSTSDVQPKDRLVKWQGGLTEAKRTVSMAELKTSNRPDKGWVAVRGQVYDLTGFLKRHPGGLNIILAAVGRDCTAVFETSHNEAATKILKKYHIGTLSGNELPTFPLPSDFSKEINRRIQNYFDITQQNPKYSPWLCVRYFFILLFVFLTYYLQFFSHIIQNNTFLLGTAAAFFGISLGQVSLHIVHDGSHGSFTRYPSAWQAMAMCNDFLYGCSSLAWFYQHVLGHHIYTNIDGADPDIAVNAVDIRRIRPWQAMTFWYWRQHIYIPVIYCFLLMKSRVLDYYHVFIRRAEGNIRINPPVASQTIVFWGGKAFCLTYRILVPYLYSGLDMKTILVLFFWVDFVQSWLLALIFQANHVVSDVKWPVPGADGEMQEDWARLQVETAQDYAHGHWLTGVLTGGLNYQVVHHLFPHHSQYYYPAMAPIIRAACIDYKIKYIVRASIWEAIGGHIGLLRFLSSAEPALGHQVHD